MMHGTRVDDARAGSATLQTVSRLRGLRCGRGLATAEDEDSVVGGEAGARGPRDAEVVDGDDEVDDCGVAVDGGGDDDDLAVPGCVLCIGFEASRSWLWGSCVSKGCRNGSSKGRLAAEVVGDESVDRTKSVW